METAKSRSAEAAASEEDLFRALRPLLLGLGEGHLSVQRSEGMICRYRAEATIMRLDLLWRDDGAFVVKGYGDAADVSASARLVGVNGNDSDKMLSDMVRFTSHDVDIKTGAAFQASLKTSTA